ncbi:MAG: hypothetical protein WC760_02855 [Bacteroidia bacterium]|jgi:uncharacterized protein YdaU (DUF1376 family)
MALRDQPYLPLYVQDFLTDEKLAQCSAETTGVYIRILCLMHKSEQYGRILLKQKHKQKDEQIENFAAVLAKQMPYEFHTVKKSLAELVDERVLLVEGDMLIQKRMVKDNEISEIRARSGKKGGDKSASVKNHSEQNFAQANAIAKSVANSEYENETANEIEKGLGGVGGKGPVPLPTEFATRIGLDILSTLPPSQYIQKHHRNFYDQAILGRNLNIEALHADFDTQSFTQFNNEKHFTNSFFLLVKKQQKLHYDGTKETQRPGRLQSVGTGAPKNFNDGHKLGT